ncbi:unnamed protein product [Clonostachys rosea f. rosea IK726]|uniref:Uncharacterized protein n=1 Tax=Clonostachys rosea f. rosea IK726 TaxID=1349383 RepID=A0ACA9TR58_BIOOC|nr:unnamed protein product [Clonostachys rosea f. rosea IK726]
MCPEVVEGQRYEQLGRYNWYLPHNAFPCPVIGAMLAIVIRQTQAAAVNLTASTVSREDHNMP